uniref:Uncharacterized protein n=1 Tax=Rhizophora mucronata TaxID=61149 RepID=A0A2P2N198_RHIMU
MQQKLSPSCSPMQMEPREDNFGRVQLLFLQIKCLWMLSSLNPAPLNCKSKTSKNLNVKLVTS